jgi:hypothetical protein
MSEKNPENHTSIWKTYMQTLTKRTRNMEVKQIIDDALFEYYSEKGQEVPNWRRNKDPQWWIDYLRELDDESKGC